MCVCVSHLCVDHTVLVSLSSVWHCWAQVGFGRSLDIYITDHGDAEWLWSSFSHPPPPQSMRRLGLSGAPTQVLSPNVSTQLYNKTCLGNAPLTLLMIWTFPVRQTLGMTQGNGLKLSREGADCLKGVWETPGFVWRKNRLHSPDVFQELFHRWENQITGLTV